MPHLKATIHVNDELRKATQWKEKLVTGRIVKTHTKRNWWNRH